MFSNAQAAALVILILTIAGAGVAVGYTVGGASATVNVPKDAGRVVQTISWNAYIPANTTAVTFNFSFGWSGNGTVDLGKLIEDWNATGLIHVPADVQQVINETIQGRNIVVDFSITLPISEALSYCKTLTLGVFCQNGGMLGLQMFVKPWTTTDTVYDKMVITAE